MHPEAVSRALAVISAASVLLPSLLLLVVNRMSPRVRTMVAAVSGALLIGLIGRLAVAFGGAASYLRLGTMSFDASEQGKGHLPVLLAAAVAGVLVALYLARLLGDRQDQPSPGMPGPGGVPSLGPASGPGPVPVAPDEPWWPGTGVAAGSDAGWPAGPAPAGTQGGAGWPPGAGTPAGTPAGVQPGLAWPAGAARPPRRPPTGPPMIVPPENVRDGWPPELDARDELGRPGGPGWPMGPPVLPPAAPPPGGVGGNGGPGAVGGAVGAAGAGGAAGTAGATGASGAGGAAGTAGLAGTAGAAGAAGAGAAGVPDSPIRGADWGDAFAEPAPEQDVVQGADWTRGAQWPEDEPPARRAARWTRPAARTRAPEVVGYVEQEPVGDVIGVDLDSPDPQPARTGGLLAPSAGGLLAPGPGGVLSGLTARAAVVLTFALGVAFVMSVRTGWAGGADTELIPSVRLSTWAVIRAVFGGLLIGSVVIAALFDGEESAADLPVAVIASAAVACGLALPSFVSVFRDDVTIAIGLLGLGAGLLAPLTVQVVGAALGRATRPARLVAGAVLVATLAIEGVLAGQVARQLQQEFSEAPTFGDDDFGEPD